MNAPLPRSRGNTRRSRLSSTGFTLIELMIVVVIIGVLSGMALPRFSAVGQQARQAEAEPILRQVSTLQEVHRERHGEYAVDGDALARVGYQVPTSLANFYDEPKFEIIGTDANEFCVWMEANIGSDTQDVEIRGKAVPLPDDNVGVPTPGNCA